MMTVEKMISLSDAWQLLAIALRYPTQELVQGLRDGSFSADLADCLTCLGIPDAQPLAAQLQDAAQQDDLLEQMRIEYTRLFITPKKEKVFIHESRFLYPKDADPKQYSMFISPCALHAEQCYKEAGVRVRKDLHEPSDHAATELEFMSYLYRRAAQAQTQAQDAQPWLGRAKAFDEKHLARWFVHFCEQVDLHTTLAVYRGIAAAAKALASIG